MTHLDFFAGLTQLPVPEDVLNVVNEVLPLGRRREVVDFEYVRGWFDDLVLVLTVHMAAQVASHPESWLTLALTEVRPV